METKTTQAARQAMMAASQRLDSEEQVSKFIAHSRMMVAVYQASAQTRHAGTAPLTITRCGW
jgi:hypothetical protein